MAGSIILNASPLTLEIPITFNDPPVKVTAATELNEPEEEAEELPDAPIEDDEEWDEDEGDDEIDSKEVSDDGDSPP